MRRDQLEYAVRTACHVEGRPGDAGVVAGRLATAPPRHQVATERALEWMRTSESSFGI